MVLEVLVLVENNMIKLEDIKVGVVVRKHNYKTTTYTITDVNSKIIINDKRKRKRNQKHVKSVNASLITR